MFSFSIFRANSHLAMRSVCRAFLAVEHIAATQKNCEVSKFRDVFYTFRFYTFHFSSACTILYTTIKSIFGWCGLAWEDLRTLPFLDILRRCFQKQLGGKPPHRNLARFKIHQDILLTSISTRILLSYRP